MPSFSGLLVGMRLVRRSFRCEWCFSVSFMYDDVDGVFVGEGGGCWIGLRRVAKIQDVCCDAMLSRHVQSRSCARIGWVRIRS